MRQTTGISTSQDQRVDRHFCISSYLAFRYVVDPIAAWAPGVVPGLPDLDAATQVAVESTEDVGRLLRSLVEAEVAARADGEVGILLSGGIDSAILAGMLPEGTKAFGIRFLADGALDETVQARRYAEAKNLDFRVIDVTWDDYELDAPTLMQNKRSPLHAVEVGLFKAARAAVDAGVRTLVLGNGADSTFGGMDKLLSRDWDFDSFVRRYTFIDPQTAVVRPVSVLSEYERYRIPAGIDFVSFLKRTHGIGIIQAFDNAIGSAGCASLEPYESLRLSGGLDLARIRSGEPKYLLQPLFRSMYPEIEPPAKIPFARPMDLWLADWAGPRRPEFRPDLDLSAFVGDRRWILWCLESFLDQLDAGSI